MKVDQIVKEYNRIMKTTSKSDMQIVEENITKFQEVAQWFSSYLHLLWNGLTVEVKNPCLSAFVKFGLLDEMFDNRFFYQSKHDGIKEKVLRDNYELLLAIMLDEEEEYQAKWSPIGIDFYLHEGKYGDDWPLPMQKRALIEKYYHLVRQEIF